MIIPPGKFYIHLFAWLIFIVLPILYIRAGNIVPATELSDFYASHLSRSLVLIALFYLNFLVLIPRFFLNKSKRWHFLILNLISFAFVFFLFKILFELHIIPGPEPMNMNPPAHPLNPLLLTMISGIAVAIGITLYQRLMKSEHKKTEVELSYLKSRLNPHFLFNTLNSIYALSVKKSDVTPDAVARLSSIMRYIITESNSKKVALEKEVNYINDFVELQKLRITGRTSVEYKFIGIAAGKQIVPLLLILFVENAFKYGVSTEHDSSISVLLSIKGDELHLAVKNSIVNRATDKQSGGLGIETARQLLEHFYQSRYHLSLGEENDVFIVNLQIQLT